MTNRIFVIVVIILTLFFLFLTFTYKFAPEYSQKNGGEFVQECNHLNGKAFIFENISQVKGFIDLNGHEKLTKEQLETFKNNNKDEERIRIYKDSWFKGPSIKYSWICEIWQDKNTNNIISAAKFYWTD